MDFVLRELVTLGAISAGLALPNLLTALDKPLNKYLNQLDGRARAREARRVIYYMKSQGLIVGEYEFGLTITGKGKKALAKLDIDNVTIQQPRKWDKTWRIIFYDIPEKHKSGRDALTSELRRLGFFQLQRSVWIHPLPCRDVIEKVTTKFQIEKYVSYVESPKLDNQAVLVARFKKRLPNVNFK